MIVVTGGAGFIGSNLLAALEESGSGDIMVCDTLRSDGKWRNLAKRNPSAIIPPEEIFPFAEAHARRIEAVFHLGAISATTATDGDLVLKRNFDCSVAWWRFCARHGIPLIYASSAAVYGDGAYGFIDANDQEAHRRLRPMNLYGWSKWLFDGWVLASAGRGEPAPPVWAGLRFFNVYGPNEYHKGAMQSLVAKIVTGHVPGQPVRLFKSHKEGFADGMQLRDFIHVDDVVAVMLWARGAGRPVGLLNVGTGAARSFLDLATSAIRACDEEPVIEYIDMPEQIRPAYQYFTQAYTARLRGLGYNADFIALEDGVSRYVRGFLLADDRFR